MQLRSRKWFGRQLLWLSFSLLCLLLSSSLHASPDKVRLRLVWKNQFQFAGYYVAKEKGFYEQEGLEVEILEKQHEIDNVEEVLSGESDFAVGRSSILINRARGDDITAMFAAFQHSPMMLLTLGKSGLSTPASLRGKRIMFTPEAKLVSEVLAMLMRAGITLGDFIQQKHSFNLDDLVNGETDAMAAYISNEPFQMQKRGLAYHVIHPKDHGFDMYSDILFTSGRMLRERPELVERFYRASLRGWLYAFEHIEESATMIFDHYNTQKRTKEALVFEGEALKNLAFDTDGAFGSITMSRLKQMLQIYLLTNIVSKDSDLTGFIYKSPISRLSISSKELEYIATKRNLSICVADGWMPYEGIEDGVHKGVVADYMKLLQEKIGIPFSIVPTSSISQARDFIHSGKCGIISAVIPTAKGSRYYEFTTPYLSVPAVIAVSSDADFGSGVPDPIAVIKDTSFEEIISVRYPGVKTVAVDTGLQGLELLQKGEVKGMLCTNAHLNSLISEHGIKGVALNEAIYDLLDISVAVKQGDLLLVGLMDKAIRSVTIEERQKITNKWINIKPPASAIPGIVWKVLLGIILVVILMMYRYWTILRHNQELSKLSQTDWLTQVPNRHRIIDRLEAFLNHSDRYSRTFSLIYFDIDDFKAINDNYGHNKGDRILKEVAKLACGVTRKADVFGRWGGEEFILACQETNIQDSVKIAEKLRSLIETHDFNLPIKVTCSFGVAEYVIDESLDHFINRADEALYQAKDRGKNIVVAYEG